MRPIGAMRDQVVILAPQTTPDSQGGQATTYVDGATVPAAIEPLSGREWLRAGAVTSALSTRITLRYRTDVTAQSRVRRVADSQVFELVGPPRDVDGRQRFLELDAVEVRT